MAINLAGLGVIFDAQSTQNQQFFQLNAVPGSLTLVAIDGVIQDPSTYTIDRSVLILGAALPEGHWVYVLSGQGGTFVPQSYVDDAVAPKANQATVDIQMAGKMDKSGGSFTGPITVPEPTQDMHPVTLQMFNSLPDIATPAYIDAAVGTKANQAWVESQLNNKIGIDQKGVEGGVAELDESRQLLMYQFPEVVFNDDKSFSKFGPLATGPGQGRWYPRYPGTIKSIVGYVELPSDGADIIVDILKITKDINGVDQPAVSLFPGADRLVIPANQKEGEYVFNVSANFVKGDKIFVELEQVGSITTGSNLSLQIEYTYTV